MKYSDLTLIAMAAGVLLFVVSKTGKAAPIGAQSNAGRSGVPANSAPVSEVMTPGGGDWQGPGAGWQYFNDGTAISPDGKYYYQGQLAYDPAALFGN